MTAALLKPPSGQVSNEDFEQFLWDYEGIERWELIDGVIRAMPEPSMFAAIGNLPMAAIHLGSPHHLTNFP